MNEQRLILWHWEALYPFTKIREGLSSLKFPDNFPDQKILVSLPSAYLSEEVTAFKETAISFGLNDMPIADPISFTGPIAKKFLLDSKAKFVLIGAAFDRNHLKSPSEQIIYKIQATLDAGLLPLICFGETFEEFREGKTEKVIHQQLEDLFSNLSKDDVKKLYLVYDTPNALLTISKITEKELGQTYEMVQRIYESVFGKDLSCHVKTICALDPYSPFPRELFKTKFFSGYAFKMIDANLTPFSSEFPLIASFLSTDLEESTEETRKELDEEMTESPSTEAPLQSNPDSDLTSIKDPLLTETTPVKDKGISPAEEKKPLLSEIPDSPLAEVVESTDETPAKTILQKSIEPLPPKVKKQRRISKKDSTSEEDNVK